MDIVQPEWPWPHELEERASTGYIVVHHTAGPQDQDTQEIWDEHIRIGDNGIAYHRVIKGDGTTVQGRPDWAQGAHAWGLNSTSVGVALEGYFHPREDGSAPDQPTDAQLTALVDNLRDLLAQYPDAQIIGHRDVAGLIGDPSAATACPGDVLYALLPDIIQEVTA